MKKKTKKSLEIFTAVFIGVIILSGIFIPIIKNNFDNNSDSIITEETVNVETDNEDFLTEDDVFDSENEIEEETEEQQLSDECDMLLCSGYNGNDYYELVATLEEDYPESIYKVGVIKNNEWLVKLSRKSPFLDKSGRWKGVEEYEDNSVSEEDFEYLGEGCFYYNAVHGSIMYKPETGVSFNTANVPNLYGQDGEVDYESIVNNGKVIAQEWKDLKLKLFDLDTGKIKKIGGYFKDSLVYPDRLYKLNDGLFLAIHYDSSILSKPYKGFFNTDGKMVINLTDYLITDFYNGVFEDKEYTFQTENDTGSSFDITIDKKGKIINKDKL